MKKMKSWLFRNIKTILETINLSPKQIKFLINIKNEKAFRDRGSGFGGAWLMAISTEVIIAETKKIKLLNDFQR
jgi:hypothetical protein